MVRELVAVTTYPLARIAPNRIVFRPGFGLQSSNYASGLSGWLIEDGGSAEFNNVVVRGTVYAGAGQIGGWSIGPSQLSAGSITLDSAIPSIRLGNASGFSTGTGIWMGQEASVYKFRVGDPAGQRLAWDGTSVLVRGDVVTYVSEIGDFVRAAPFKTALYTAPHIKVVNAASGQAVNFPQPSVLSMNEWDWGAWGDVWTDPRPPSGYSIVWAKITVSIYSSSSHSPIFYLRREYYDTTSNTWTKMSGDPDIKIDLTQKVSMRTQAPASAVVWVPWWNTALTQQTRGGPTQRLLISAETDWSADPAGSVTYYIYGMQIELYASKGGVSQPFVYGATPSGTPLANTSVLMAPNINLVGTLTVQSGGQLVAGPTTLDSSGLTLQGATSDYSPINSVKWYYGGNLIGTVLTYILGLGGPTQFSTTTMYAYSYTNSNNRSAITVTQATDGTGTLNMWALPAAAFLLDQNTIRLRRTIQWNLDVGLSTYPTSDDLLLFASNRTLFCVGRVNVWLAGNVYWDGLNWNLFDTNSNGIAAAVVSDSRFFGVWSVPAGTNPRPLNLRAVLANQASPVSQHILYNQSGGAQTDWPAGWGGGLATADVNCANIYYSALVQRSDPRLKENIAELADRAVEKVRQLKPVKFRFKEHGYRERRGLLATDVHAVLPEICEFDEEGNPVGYDLSELVTYLVKAVKELSEELATLKGRRS